MRFPKHLSVSDISTSTKIDCLTELGRTAKGIAWVDTTGHAHEMTMRLNGIRRSFRKVEGGPEELVVSWRPTSSSDIVATLSSSQGFLGIGTGMFEGLEIVSVEILSVPHTGTLLHIW